MFMGALLLLAAVMTWSIGLMMSPHGETVARGTEHLRTTVVIFKRNGAIGTLILCALGAWLLFPARRLKWPARDWTLIALLVFLAGSSLYTLIWLTLAVPHTDNLSENLASTNMDLNEGGADMNSVGMNAASSAEWNQAEISAPVIPSQPQVKAQPRAELEPISKAEFAREPRETQNFATSPENDEEPTNDSAEQNQE
jgi:hypothetical protein